MYFFAPRVLLVDYMYMCNSACRFCIAVINCYWSVPFLISFLSNIINTFSQTKALASDWRMFWFKLGIVFCFVTNMQSLHSPWPSSQKRKINTGFWQYVHMDKPRKTWHISMGHGAKHLSFVGLSPIFAESWIDSHVENERLTLAMNFIFIIFHFY